MTIRQRHDSEWGSPENMTEYLFGTADSQIMFLFFAQITEYLFWGRRFADLNAMSNPINTAIDPANFILLTRKITGGTNAIHDRWNRVKSEVKFFKNGFSAVSNP